MDFDLIIIGNGDSARDFEAGEIIDSIPNVLRFNKYFLGNWSKYVGSRTTHWVTYFSHGKTDDYKEIWSTCFKSNARFQRFKNNHPTGRRFTDEVVKRSKEALGYDQPSSGVYALIQYVEFSNFKNIAIYGFDHFERERKHYAGDKAGWVGVHNPELEKKLFTEYYEAGKISHLSDYLI